MVVVCACGGERAVVVVLRGLVRLRLRLVRLLASPSPRLFRILNTKYACIITYGLRPGSDDPRWVEVRSSRADGAQTTSSKGKVTSPSKHRPRPLIELVKRKGKGREGGGAGCGGRHTGRSVYLVPSGEGKGGKWSRLLCFCLGLVVSKASSLTLKESIESNQRPKLLIEGCIERFGFGGGVVSAPLCWSSNQS